MRSYTSARQAPRAAWRFLATTLLFRAQGLQVGVVRNGRADLVPITIGRDYGATVEVASGLHRTDAVILSPSDSLIDGTPVRVETGASNETFILNPVWRSHPASIGMHGRAEIRASVRAAHSGIQGIRAHNLQGDGWLEGSAAKRRRRSAETGGSCLHDSQLNALENQVDGANQTLKQAEANFRAARAAIRRQPLGTRAVYLGRTFSWRRARFDQPALLQ